MTTFNDFGLHADINRALAAKDYTTPTPIQTQAIPPLMKGRDLLRKAMMAQHEGNIEEVRNLTKQIQQLSAEIQRKSQMEKE